MPLSSQAQWRQVFALAKRGELPMATAREMAEASAPYDSLPAYAGAGPDQCKPHWHHVDLPSGETIRTDEDCHVGAAAMENESASMQVAWGGKVPVQLDMRTKGPMIYGVATIRFPGVATPVRSTISANWQEIYQVLRKRSGGGTAGYSEPEIALHDMQTAAMRLDNAQAAIRNVLREGHAVAGYSKAETMLAARELLRDLSIATDHTESVADALANLNTTLRGVMEDAAAVGQYPSALSMGGLGDLKMFDPGGEITSSGAEFNLTAPDWNVEIAVGEDELGGHAAGDQYTVVNGYGRTAAITALAAMTALAGTRGRAAFGRAGADTPLPRRSIKNAPHQLAAYLALAALAAVAFWKYPAARSGGAYSGAGAPRYFGPAAATALAAMAAYGIADLGRGAEAGAFDLVRQAHRIARSDVVKNLRRVVKKSLDNPMIRHAMQLDKRGRSQYAVKIAARIYDRAKRGDKAARRVIARLAQEHGKGSPFAGRALRLLNLGRQHYGARLSGDHVADNRALVGLVDAYGSAGLELVSGRDFELELLLESATGVGAWEGVNWIADRLKWRSMSRHAGDTTGRALLLAGRRAQAAAYIPGRL